MRVLNLMLCLLLLVAIFYTATSDKLVGYANFGHVLIFDKETRMMASYDIRQKSSSPMCDILHYPPVAPPTILHDYVSTRSSSQIRLFHLFEESFMMMDGETGSYTTYKCQGFQPFLSALPCKVVSIGASPSFAGNFRVAATDISRRLLTYNAENGEAALHWLDSDIVTGDQISKLPIGINDKRLKTTIPGVVGDASVTVVSNPNLLVILQKAPRALKIFKFFSSAETAEQIIGAMVFESSSLLPDWVDEVVAVHDGNFLVYNSKSSQYQLFKLSLSSDNTLQITNSSVQYFSGALGFMSGHGCLHEGRTECFSHEGCGWCPSTQKCLHMAEKLPCDESCTDWCYQDTMDCLNADEIGKLVAPRPPVLDPKLTSPKDVAEGLVIANQTLFKPDIDVIQVKTGVVFGSPENNSVGCMNAGVNGSETNEENGCNDNPLKRKARSEVVDSTASMNNYKGKTLVVTKPVPVPTQFQPDEDCAEIDTDGTRIKFETDSPLKEGDGSRPVPVGPGGGRWNMSQEIQAESKMPVTSLDSMNDVTNSTASHKSGQKVKPLTEGRYKKFVKHSLIAEQFSPSQGPTVSVHEMMNDHKNQFTAVHATIGMTSPSAHGLDESRLKPNLQQFETFIPTQGEIQRPILITSPTPDFSNSPSTPLPAKLMESGCEESGLVISSEDPSNFMNSVAMADDHIKDNDGTGASGTLVSGYTLKQLGSLSLDQLINLLKEQNLAIPTDVTKSQAIDLLRGILTPQVQSSFEAAKFNKGILPGQADQNTHLQDWQVDPTHDIESFDPNMFTHQPIIRIENSEINSHYDYVPPPEPKFVSPSSSPAPSPANWESQSSAPIIRKGYGNIGINKADNSINPIPLEEAKNIDGLEPHFNPLGSIGAHIQLEEYSNTTDNRRNATEMTITTTAVEEPATPIAVPVAPQGNSFVFAPAKTFSQSIGTEIDPLVEYRNEEEDVDVSEAELARGCVSTEDAFTGNSQPRIDFLGNSQILHVHPLLATWALYNVTFGLSSAHGPLEQPFKPIRRTFLGGPDNRFLEHHPITGGFKVFKCPNNAIFQNCEEYCSGQWGHTINTNDVFVSLSEHLVLVYNIDIGTWRVFNFDRDVTGSADPFSTATPPISAGKFPFFEDDEVVHLGNGVLLVHDPPSGEARFYRFDFDVRTMYGPTHSGIISGGDNYRVTGLDNGKIIVYKARGRHCDIYDCYSNTLVGQVDPNPFFCNFHSQMSLYASGDLTTSPVLHELLSVQSFSQDPQWETSDRLYLLDQGKVTKMSGKKEDIDGLLTGTYLPQIRVAEHIQNISKILLRPNHEGEMVFTISSDATEENHQLFLYNTVKGLLPISIKNNNNNKTHYVAGQFSNDGELFSFTSTSYSPLEKSFVTDVYVAQMSSISPTKVRTYNSQVTLGPFSQDNRYLALSIENPNVPQDNDVELIDILNGHTVQLTSSRDVSREPSIWDIHAGAIFHPIERILFIVSNENQNYKGLQMIDFRIPSSPKRTWVVNNILGDIVSVSFDHFVQRCAVTASFGGFADYHVYLIDQFNTFTELKRPFLADLFTVPRPLILSPDGTKFVTIKETANEPGQIYLGRIVEMPQPGPDDVVEGARNQKVIPRNVTRAFNSTQNVTQSAQPRLPVVSVLMKLTISEMPVPYLINDLPNVKQVSFTSYDGLKINAFHFLPSMNDLFEDVLVPLNKTDENGSLITKPTNSTRYRIQHKLIRPPPYIIYVPDAPFSAASPTLWGSVELKTLNYLRTLGVGILVPNVRGGANSGKRFGLMGLREKRGHIVQDIKAAREFLCSGNLLIDCNNIGIAGSSSAGIDVISAIAQDSSLWKLALDISGVSHIKTLLQSVSPLEKFIDSRVFSSDESQIELAPLRQAINISTPTFVAHGTSDPIVPVSQAEEIVAQIRANHNTVNYLPLYDEGHTIKNMENKITMASAIATFVLEQFGMLGDN
eukprot:c12796_g1_i1.p1 GENE.c12796_g1_i1~~c12796_g1_i1.p1  ORF type:complete len:1947 (-),score=858.49 c12796_g1_i1:184-6024(-)